MTISQDVIIQIDDSHANAVCDSTVGFLKFNREGKFETALPVGTGTFAKIGSTYGILTAGHVLNAIGTEGDIGLVRFPGITPALQNFRLNLSYTDRILDWKGIDTVPPDIAFLKIPDVHGRNLEAKGAVFYNLQRDRNFTASNPKHQMSKCYAVVGVVAEWTEESAMPPSQARKIVIGGLFGAAKNLREFQESGVDLVDVEVDFSEGMRSSKSYGGVSGGALWELHVELDKAKKIVKVSKRLYGVAFRQSADHKRITSNGATPIEEITKQAVAKWPR